MERQGAPSVGTSNPSSNQQWFPFPDLTSGGHLPAVVLLGVCLASYIGYLPWQGQVAAVGLVFIAASIVKLGRLLKLGPRGVMLDDNGLMYGRRFVAWRDITGLFKIPGRGPIVVQVAEQGMPYVDRLLRSSGISIKCFPIVLLQVVPAILARRPDLSPSPGIEEAFAQAGRHPRWDRPRLILALLLMAGLMLVDCWVARELSIWWLLLPVAAVLAVPAGSWWMRLPDTRIERWTRSLTATGLLVPLPLPALHIMFDVPLRCFDAAMAAGAAFLVAGAWFYSRSAQFTLRRELVMSAVVVAAALLAALISPRAIEGRILEFVPKGKGFVAARSPDGRFAVGEVCIDFHKRSVRDMPPASGPSFSWYFSQAGLLRVERVAGGQALLLYSHNIGKETSIASAGGIKISGETGIAPDGRRICWVEFVSDYYRWPDPKLPGLAAAIGPLATSDPASSAASPAPSPATMPKDPPEVAIYDVKTGQVRRVAGPWRDMPEVEWEYCWWVNNDELAIVGSEYVEPPPDRPWARPPGPLHVIRFRPADGQASHLVSKGAYRAYGHTLARASSFWRNPTTAFAYDGDGNAWYIDLERQVESRLERASRTWHPSGDYALAVVHPARFCRIDAKTGEMTVLLDLGHEWRIQGWSPSGRYVLANACTRVNPLRLVEVASGRRFRLETSWVTGEITGMVPNDAAWSPDERTLLLEAQWDLTAFRNPMAGGRLMEFTIPE